MKKKSAWWFTVDDIKMRYKWWCKAQNQIFSDPTQTEIQEIK